MTKPAPNGPRSLERASPQFLASVTSVAEAEIALRGGAEIIDCKDPQAGALGALPVGTVLAIRKAVPAGCMVSATIGDLAAEPGPVTAAAKAMAETGVDFVKIGFFPGGDAKATIRALGAAFGAAPKRGARGRLMPSGAPGALAPPVEMKPQHDAAAPRLVGLLLADRGPDFSLIAEMAAAGFVGVMLDTADKSAGPLTKAMPVFRLSLFVKEAHRVGLFAGLAGSLRKEHIAMLAGLGPDILGFRGGLCRKGERTSAIDPRAVEEVAQALGARQTRNGGLSRGELRRA